MKKKKHNNGAVTKLDLSHGVLPEGHQFVRPKGFDPMKLPWPFPDGSIEEAYSGFLFQRVPATQRGSWMQELWRCLVPGGRCTIITPYWSSMRAVQDPSAEWPPICEASYLYYNKDFLLQNKLPPVAANFSFSYGYNLDPEIANKSDDVRGFGIKRYLNAISDLHVVLVKIA